MIKSFKDARTELLFQAKGGKGVPPNLIRPTARKLAAVASATTLDDLRVPPGNQLEALTGDRKGQHSIRINSQWRICFRWRDGHAHDVEFTDYH